ncbi:TIGR03899 family protein [Aeromonas schubertii]|uniref:TIGR03899 family protein n=1 Tax=Aeromonas schubertii TaxID=652 RepID=A0ABS7VFZ5_9GAMM|nr:TIGR03899 family protein [Aeromonas schubertii]MBZ6067878.1 TIGR03899 family protein [Aeromonas schubertii]MBZ6074044.1 TIGR03899 family protein [Aeromonas schubertii]
MSELPPPKRDSSNILSSQEQTLRLARSRHIDGMLTKNSDSTFEQRATFRLAAEQATRQRNLETIMVMAQRHCGEIVAGGEPDPDWVTRFLQLAEEIGSVPMQQLWGRIFALEIAAPGSFSIRALTTLKEMTQRDAMLFQRLCALSCNYVGSEERRLLTGLYQGARLLTRAKSSHMGLGKYRLPYNALLQLFELGLLHKGELESGELPAEGLELAFSHQRWRLQGKQSHTKLIYYRLTPVGNELARLLEEPSLEEYLKDLQTLLAQGLVIEVTVTAPPPQEEKGG